MSTEQDDPTDTEFPPTFAGVFGDIAEALLTDHLDLVDVLDRLMTACVAILEVDAAAVVLDDQRGRLLPVASSSEDAGLLELVQLHMDEGPCLDAIRDNVTIRCPDLETEHERWPIFCDSALKIGFRRVVAVPLRVNGRNLGGLNLFGHESGPLSDDRVLLAQGLTQLAALAIFHQQSARSNAALAEQLQHALTSRVAIEQAKGIIAERFSISLEAAFDRIRRYARDHNLKLGDVSAGVISGEISPSRA